jgi:hypothetical protein
MAAREVIHFFLWAQLSLRLLFPARIPPESVSKSPPVAFVCRENLFPVQNAIRLFQDPTAQLGKGQKEKRTREGAALAPRAAAR